MSVVPSAAALVIKALKEPERDQKKTKNIKHNDNTSLDDVIEIAKVMKPRSMAKDFFFFLRIRGFATVGLAVGLMLVGLAIRFFFFRIRGLAICSVTIIIFLKFFSDFSSIFFLGFFFLESRKNIFF